MILATVCPSDELPSFLWPASTTVFLIAAGLGVASLALLWVRPGSSGKWLAAAGFLIGLIPVAFAAHVYQIDFVAVAWDGTPASGPLWKALVVPSLPPIASAILMIVHYRRKPFACGPAPSPFRIRK